MKAKKLNKTNIENKTSRILLIVLGAVIGLLIGVIGFYFSKDATLIILAPFVVITITLFLDIKPLSFNKEKQKENEALILKKFYDDFFQYSFLCTSFIEGFKIAIDNLDVSNLKDDLNDFLENNMSSSLPLNFLNTRKENELIEMISSSLNEEYTIDTYKAIKSKYDSYKPSLAKKKETLSAYFLPFFLTILFVAIVAILIINYERS